MKINKLNIYFFLIGLGFSIIFFTYVFYKSEIFAEGNKHSYYFKYYVISAFLFLFSFVLLFLKKKLIFAFITIALSTLISFYGIELFLTFKFKEPPNEKLRYIKEFRKADPKIVPIIFSADQMYGRNINDSIAPLAGISKKETIFCEEDGPLIRYQSDRFGFNNLNQIWDEQDIFAITIGDSFTHGACVDTKNTIAYKLDKNKFILNLGMGGTGPLVQFATLREYLNRANPKNIIWIYYEENDFLDLIYEKSQPILAKYLADDNFSQQLTLKQKEIDEKLLRIIHFEIDSRNTIKTKKIKNFIKLKFMRQFVFDKASTDEKILIPGDFMKIMKKASKLAKDKDVKFYFVYMPEKERFVKNELKNGEFRNYHKVIKIINDLDISLIDLNIEFKKNYKDPIVMYNESQLHLSVLGYNKAAELIYKKINELNK